MENPHNITKNRTSSKKIISGIYKIQSKLFNERFYIGSAINLHSRKAEHLWHLRKGTHHSKKLQNHFNKYGEDDLIFIVIEPCLPEFLIIIEDRYLNPLPYFNICPVAGNVLGRKCSELTKQKIGDSNKGKTKGIKLSRERIEQHSKRMIGNKYREGKPTSDWQKKRASECSKNRSYTEENRKRLREAKLGEKNPNFGKIANNAKPITQFSTDGVLIKNWISLKEASKILEISQGNISNCLSGKKKTSGKFIWKLQNK